MIVPLDRVTFTAFADAFVKAMREIDESVDVRRLRAQIMAVRVLL